ncbi:MAG TPA: ABC transporter substrate-binding protein [Candidatus Limnocylindrales bacterium]
MRSLRTAAAAIAVLAITLSACTSGATTAPSQAPVSVAPSTAPSVAPGSAASAAPTPAASSAVIPLPSNATLAFAGKLVICSDIPYPPQEFFDASGNPTGSDIDVGTEIAKRLGLTADIQNSVFDTIIAAVTSGKCDIIISAQNITADRIKQVDMIPYFQAGQSFVVATGNPAAINATTDLCGKKVAAETGTTEIDYLQGTGDYKGQGLSAACTKAGKAAINIKSFGKDSDALLALQSGQVDAYFADSPVAGYYTVQHPDQFALSGIAPLQPAFEGISVPQSNTGLRDAVQAALVAMINDGTYLTILKKYGDDSGAVTAADAGTVNKLK